MNLNSVSFCPTCKAICYTNYCKYCKTAISTTPIEVTQAPKTFKKEEDKTDSTWIGPVQPGPSCFHCGSTSFYYMVLTPFSPDEPPIIRYRCEGCKRLTSEYKN